MDKRMRYDEQSFFLRSGVKLLSLVVCMALGEWLMLNPFFGALIYLGVYVIVAAVKIGSYGDGGFGRVSSYRYFSLMQLYATVAVELGAMMMFCHILLVNTSLALWNKYLMLLGWVVTIFLSGWLYSRFASRRWRGQALAEFVAGAVTWVLGDVFMFRAASGTWGLVCTVVWTCGIVLIYLSLYNFARDFKAVGAIADERLDGADLHRSNVRQSRLATLVSSGVMMLVMVLWTFRGHALLDDPRLPRVLHVTMMQLPVLFMLVALYFALRQPFDSRNREKLMLFIEQRTSNERIRASLRHQLVRGHRVSFWSRLLCWAAMPLLHHKVQGKSFLRKGDYPSVFVCNHGFLYGPIVAALFLPTYFRPWIHDRMLREDLARREISMSFPWVKKVFGKKLGDRLIAVAARLTVRLLLSFRPIAVVRGATREAMTTFDESLAALEEGDNLMIFAEKPKRLNTGDNPDLRNLYTGFAHIGKLYHDATGRRLLFYPVYSNQKRRTISIGQPVEYDASLEPREAKQAVAETLQRSMEALAQ